MLILIKVKISPTLVGGWVQSTQVDSSYQADSLQVI